MEPKFFQHNFGCRTGGLGTTGPSLATALIEAYCYSRISMDTTCHGRRKDFFPGWGSLLNTDPAIAAV